MATKKLTAAFVRSAKADAGAERTVFWDETLPGFGLAVMSSGHKSFVAQYRSKGLSRRYTIGNAAVLELDQARKKAKSILGQVAHGADPLLEKRRVAESDRHSLKAVCERYLHREGGKIRTADIRRATLERLVYPRLGARPVDAVRRLDIVHLLDDIEDTRGPAMADQTLAILRKIFNWHAVRSSDFRTPIVPGMARTKAEDRERSRVLSDVELRAVWSTAESYAGPWGQFVRFLLLTAARRSEVAAMAWAEMSERTWAIPPARHKTAASVVLPLSGAAEKVLDEVPRVQGCEFVFSTDGRRPISGFSTFKLRFDIACGVKDWRLHDLRRTARSLMSRAGIAPDIAERCLGHVIGGVRGVYDRHDYAAQMRHAFEALAALIERIVHPGLEENVVELRKSREESSKVPA
jgi:integrase